MDFDEIAGSELKKEIQFDIINQSKHIEPIEKGRRTLWSIKEKFFDLKQ